MGLKPAQVLFALLLMGSVLRANDLDKHDGSAGIWIRGEAIEAFVATVPRFRVMAIRRVGTESIVAGSAVSDQGLRVGFMQSDQPPNAFEVGNKPAEIVERAGDRVKVRLPAAEGVRYTITIEADPKRAQLRLQYELTNATEAPRAIACWSVISYAREGAIVVPFGEKPRSRKRLLVPWWTSLPQPCVKAGRDGLLVDAGGPVEGPVKVGVITDCGWIAFARGRQALISRVTFDPAAKYPEDGANITLFQTDPPATGRSETEQVAPLREIAPGQSTTMSEAIDLVSFPESLPPDPDAARKVIEAASTKP